MTSQADTSRPIKPPSSQRAPGWSRDLVTAGLGVWLVAAVFSDGWAHFNVPQLESFFTPWHAALYAGLLVTAGWLVLVAWRGRSVGRSLIDWLPHGYRGTVLGVALFGLGGVADLVWHEVFGIEVAVDALVSPSHLLLGTGGILILTSGLRAQGVLSRRDQPAKWTLPALLSLVLTTALVSFFLLYTSPFAMPAPVNTFIPTPEGAPGHQQAELPVIASLGGYLVTTTLITVPVLLMLRSGAGLPRGGVTLTAGAIAGLPVAVVDFPATPVAGAIGATIGALIAELVISSTASSALRTPPFLAAMVVFLVWSGQFAGLALNDAVRWPVSLWLGVVVLSGFVAASLGLLSSPTEAASHRETLQASPAPSLATEDDRHHEKNDRPYGAHYRQES